MDFNDDASYRNPATTEFGDVNKDGKTEELKTELTQINSLGTSAEGMVQIGNETDKTFKGEFDGNNYKISNMLIGTLASSNKSTDGMFGYNEGKIKNLTLENTTWGTCKNDISVGMLVGINNGSIENITINNISHIDSKGNNKVGIIVGENGGTVSNSSVSGTYSATRAPIYYIAGITNINTGNVKDCKNDMILNGVTIAVINMENSGIVTGCQNNADFKVNGKSVAGIVEINNGTVSNCVNAGSFDSAKATYIGGIVETNNGTVNNCVNTGSFNSSIQTHIGGIITRNKSDKKIEYCDNGTKDIKGEIAANYSGAYAAGIVAENSSPNLNIENCNNYFDITSTSVAYISGIIATVGGEEVTANISNSVNMGNIKGENTVGIVGSTAPDNTPKTLTITNCINKGNIEGNATIAGISNICGTENTLIENCKNYGNIDGSGGFLAGILSKGKGGTIRKCDNYGKIGTNAESTGGIVGAAYEMTIEDCNNGNEELKNSTEINMYNLSFNIGGIAGIIGNTTITNSNNYLMIVDSNLNLGGIVGNVNGDNNSNGSRIKNCNNYATMDFRNKIFCGAIIPDLQNAGVGVVTVTGCQDFGGCLVD